MPATGIMKSCLDIEIILIKIKSTPKKENSRTFSGVLGFRLIMDQLISLDGAWKSPLTPDALYKPIIQKMSSKSYKKLNRRYLQVQH